MKRLIFLAFLLAIGGLLYTSKKSPTETIDIGVERSSVFEDLVSKSELDESEKTVSITQTTLTKPPSQKFLPNDYHIYQTFNNCGPAAMSMALSYYDINKSQYELGQILRPYQNSRGDNDDKSVTLEEIAELSKEYDLVPFRRPNGNIETIKYFITYDIPVITRTWLDVDDDIGHYRVIKGYDDINNQLLQDDSLQGHNLSYSYDKFMEIWGHFGYEYLVLVPKDKENIALQILGENSDEAKAWKLAVKNFEELVAKNPDDFHTRFSLSVALFNAEDYKRSVEEFEKIETQLPFRTLWYQIEPIEAYFKLGEYERVFEITDRILSYHNRAFSELYLLRGRIYVKQGEIELAKEEFEKAVFYNVNMKDAINALNSVDTL